MARQLVSIGDAANHVGVNPRTIRRWISEGRLPAYRTGPRLVRIKLDDLDNLGERIPTAGAGDAA